MKFALPFAAYRAGLGGPSVLASEEPGAVLPRLTLASIIHGMGGMRRAMTYTAQTIAYTWDMGGCSEGVCVLNDGLMEVLKKISDVLSDSSEGDVLSSLRYEDVFCVDCAKRLRNSHRGCREHLFRTRLPSLLDWESWEGV